MDHSGTDPGHSRSLGFDIDPSQVTLSEIFSAAMHCLGGATDRMMKQQGFSDVLQISLIRLRMSRLGANHKIYEEPGLESTKEASDVADAKRYF